MRLSKVQNNKSLEGRADVAKGWQQLGILACGIIIEVEISTIVDLLG